MAEDSPGRTTIAVHERMDADEPGVQPNRRHNRSPERNAPGIDCRSELSDVLLNRTRAFSIRFLICL
jgi:hypothetical protein